MSSHKNSVLFVCTANRIRSVIAEALFNQKLAEMDETQNWIVDSAGTWAGDALPPMPTAIETMSARGVDIRGHKSKPIEGVHLADFNLILVMERGHQEAIQQEFPDVAERVHLLSEMVAGGYEVDDPAAGTLRDHSHAAEIIEQAINSGFERITALSREVQS